MKEAALSWGVHDLPPVSGRYQSSVMLAEHTWFKVGGPAAVVFKPHDVQDLAFFLKHRPSECPLLTLGAGSNIIVRDGGFSGCVIRLARGFSHIRVEDNCIVAGAGALDRTVSLVAADHGLAGLGFLCGIPGTLGGAVTMNAGAYGTELKDILVEACVLDPQGTLHRLTPEDLGFSYRHSCLPEGWIVVEVRLRGKLGHRVQDLHQEIKEILQRREETQPVRGRTGGSTFKNPPGHAAWTLIDQAGCRGLSVGGAHMSEKHCNFMLNTGHATAHDLETLGEQVRERVQAATGVSLEWEIMRVGQP